MKRDDQVSVAVKSAATTSAPRQSGARSAARFLRKSSPSKREAAGAKIRLGHGPAQPVRRGGAGKLGAAVSYLAPDYG